MVGAAFDGAKSYQGAPEIIPGHYFDRARSRLVIVSTRESGLPSVALSLTNEPAFVPQNGTTARHPSLRAKDGSGSGSHTHLNELIPDKSGCALVEFPAMFGKLKGPGAYCSLHFAFCIRTTPGPSHFNKEQTPLAILRYQPAVSRRLFWCLWAHLL
jgi:hypothetical protein